MHNTVSNNGSSDGSSKYDEENDNDISKSSIKENFNNRLSFWSVQNSYYVENKQILPDITEQSRNAKDTPSIIINNKTNKKDTALSENIQFRSVNNNDEKSLSEDVARDYAQKLVLNQDIIISEISVLARSCTSNKIVDEAMARKIK